MRVKVGIDFLYTPSVRQLGVTTVRVSMKVSSLSSLSIPLSVRRASLPLSPKCWKRWASSHCVLYCACRLDIDTVFIAVQVKMSIVFLYTPFVRQSGITTVRVSVKVSVVVVSQYTPLSVTWASLLLSGKGGRRLNVRVLH